jgi:hypothetical protein
LFFIFYCTIHYGNCSNKLNSNVDIGGKIGKIFDHINELPKDVIPTASIAVVKSCLTKMGMTASDSNCIFRISCIIESDEGERRRSLRSVNVDVFDSPISNK